MILKVISLFSFLVCSLTGLGVIAASGDGGFIEVDNEVSFEIVECHGRRVGTGWRKENLVGRVRNVLVVTRVRGVVLNKGIKLLK